MATRAFDPYATLGIPAGASREEAARAHRRLAKEFHPDVNPGAAAAARMRDINEAWRILSRPARRTPFDADGPAPAWPGPGYRSASSRASNGAYSGFGGAHAAGSTYGPRTRSAGWAAWPEEEDAARPASPRPRQRGEPSFGDRPVVFVAIWVFLALLYFLGSWLGSIPA